MTVRDPQIRPPSPWWPRREPWRPAPVVKPGPREVQLAPPPPPPPLLSRVAGGVLLAATLGLASCQALVAAVS